MNVYHLGWIKLFNQKIAGIRLHQPDESRLVICLRGKDGIRWQIWPIFFFKVHFRSDGGSLFEPSDLKPESSGIRNLTNFTHSQMFASFYPPKKGNGGTRVTSHDVSSLCQIFEPLTSSIEKNHHKSNHHHLNTCGLPTQPTNSCSNLSEWNGIIFQSQIMGGHFRNRFPIHSPHFIPWRSESLGCPCALPVMKTLKKRESAAGNRRCPQWVWGCWLINHGRLKCFTDKLFFCQTLFAHEITLLSLRRSDSALIVWTLRCSFAKRRHTKPRNNLYEPKRVIQIGSRLLLWPKHIFSACTIFGGSKSPPVGISDPRQNVNGNLESRFSGWQLIGVKQDWILKPQTWWIAPKLNMCFMVPIVQFIISKLMQVIIFKWTRLKSLQIANGKHPAPPFDPPFTSTWWILDPSPCHNPTNTPTSFTGWGTSAPQKKTTHRRGWIPTLFCGTSMKTHGKLGNENRKKSSPKLQHISWGLDSWMFLTVPMNWHLHWEIIVSTKKRCDCILFLCWLQRVEVF